MELKIGDKIAKYRKLKGYTQEQLGELVGVSGQAVSKWEHGGVPDTYLLPTISKVLGVSIDALFGVEKRYPITLKMIFLMICLNFAFRRPIAKKIK